MAKLLEQTNDVEYDMEAYAKDSLKVINDIVGNTNKCKANFEKLVEKIGEEQEMSGRQRTYK